MYNTTNQNYTYSHTLIGNDTISYITISRHHKILVVSTLGHKVFIYRCYDSKYTLNQTITFAFEHLLKTGCQPGLVAANMTSPLSRANILNNQDYLFARRLFKTALLPRNYKRLSTHEFLVITRAIWIKLARLKHWQNCIFRHKYLFALPLNGPLICFN